jgi:glycerophosphoryl diester phosphodiesterase
MEEVQRRMSVGVWWRAGPLRIGAHRGDSSVAPENTLAAFRAAADANVDYLEVDIRRSADGQLVVIHDAGLERTTSGRGPVDRLTARELFALDAGSWFSSDYSGERIPSFDGFLEWLGGTGLGAMVEAKAPGVGAEVASRLAAQPFSERLAVCSFSGAEVKAAKQAAPELPCILILPDCRTAEEVIREVVRWGVDGANLPADCLNLGLMEQLRQAGMIVTGGTANQPDLVARLVGLGVDAADTDRPKMALAARSAALEAGSLP